MGFTISCQVGEGTVASETREESTLGKALFEMRAFLWRALWRDQFCKKIFKKKIVEGTFFDGEYFEESTFLGEEHFRESTLLEKSTYFQGEHFG